MSVTQPLSSRWMRRQVNYTLRVVSLLAVVGVFGAATVGGGHAGDMERRVSRHGEPEVFVYAVPGDRSTRVILDRRVRRVVVERCRIVAGYLHPWCRINGGSGNGWMNSYYLSY